MGNKQKLHKDSEGWERMEKNYNNKACNTKIIIEDDDSRSLLGHKGKAINVFLNLNIVLRYYPQYTAGFPTLSLPSAEIRVDNNIS